MKKTILVTVNKERIKTGLRDSCSRCPIALAIKAHKGFKGAGVGLTFAFTKPREGLDKTLALLPPEAKLFITRFDNNKKVMPFKFSLTF